MKILNLIQYSDEELYQEMRDIQRELLKKLSPNTTYYFYCYREDLNSAFTFEGDMLYLKGKDSLSTMSAKTYDALAAAFHHIDFDLLVRTNVSTLCKVEKVAACFSQTKNLYGGNEWKEVPFISGICVVLTRDMVQRFVESKSALEFHEPEDIMIAKFFASIGIPMTPINQHFGWNIDQNDENIFVFRNKRNDRQQDLRIMRKIVQEILSTEPKSKIMSLNQCAKNNINDKHVDYGHDYILGYHSLFHEKQQTVTKLLEIGIGNKQHEAAMQRRFGTLYRCGNSLRMWRDYFMNANIYSIDIDVGCMIKDESRITTFVADQTSETELANVLLHIGTKIDIIIDDGSHIPAHQVFSFQILHNNLANGGIYVIEDIQPGVIDAFSNLSIFPDHVAKVIRDNYTTSVIDTRQNTGIADDLLFVLCKK